jgi:hypothetical protein
MQQHLQVLTKNNIRYTIVSILIGIFLNGCSFKEVDVQKHTDELLNCEKLTTQIADLMDINKEINNGTGLTKSSLATWIFWPPAGVYNQYSAYVSRDKLDDRLEHLLRLKYQNNCYITYKERYYIKHKDRLSDFFK